MSIQGGTQMEEEVSISMPVSEARKWLETNSYRYKTGLNPNRAAYSITRTIYASKCARQTETIIDLLSNTTAWFDIIKELKNISDANEAITIMGTEEDYEFYPKEYLSDEMKIINSAMKKYLDTNPVPGKYSFEDFKKIYTELLQGIVTARSSSRPQRRTSNIHTLADLQKNDSDSQKDFLEITGKNIQLSAKELRDQQDVVYKQQDQVKGQFNELHAQLNQFNQFVSGLKKDIGDATSWQKKYTDEHIRSAKLSSENEALNAELKSARERMEQTKKDNERLQDSLNQKTAEYVKKTEELSEKEKKMKELENEYNERDKEYNARISGQLPGNRQREQELLQEKNAINAYANQLYYEIQQKRGEVSRLEWDLKTAQQQLKTAQQQAEFERIRAERAEKENKSTMSSLLNTMEETGRLTGVIAGNRQQMAMQKDRIDELKYELGDARAKGNAQQQKMMEMDEETTAYKVRFGIADAKLEMTQDQYNKIEKELQDKEKEMNRMRDAILQLTYENATLIGKTEQLQYQLQEGINAFGRLQLDYKTVVEDKDKILSENIELHKQRNELVSNVHMLTHNAYINGQATEAFTNRDLKEQIRITQKEKEDYKEKKEKLESKLERKKEKEEKKKKKRERTKVQVEQNEKEKEQLSKELSQLRIEYAVQKKENEHNREKIEELERRGALVPINQVIPSSAQEQDLARTFELRDYIREALEYTVGEKSVKRREIYYGQLETYDSVDEMEKKYKGLLVTESGKAYAKFSTDRSRYDAAFIGIDRWIGDTKSVIWVRVDQYINWDTKNKQKLALQMENLSYWNGIIESTKVPLLKESEDLK